MDETLRAVRLILHVFYLTGRLVLLLLLLIRIHESILVVVCVKIFRCYCDLRIGYGGVKKLF